MSNNLEMFIDDASLEMSARQLLRRRLSHRNLAFLPQLCRRLAHLQPNMALKGGRKEGRKEEDIPW